MNEDISHESLQIFTYDAYDVCYDGIVVTAALDSGLDAQGTGVVPGVGNFGDRYVSGLRVIEREDRKGRK